MIEDLIYDVGMHQGTDTEFYLRKGFRVVAVEANPELVNKVKDRRKDDVANGQLTIVELAITDRTGFTDFWIATDDDAYSSLTDKSVPTWSGKKRIQVKCDTFDTVLQKHGIPYYLKIDIEGADLRCLKAMRGFETKPKFVSFECRLQDFESTFDGLAELWAMGYRRFKLVNQARHNELRCPNPPREGNYVETKFTGSTSGPFGEETPGEWLTIGSIIEKCLQCGKHQATRLSYETSGRICGIPMQRLHHWLKWVYNSPPGKMFRKGYATLMRREIGGWFDIHARYGDQLFLDWHDVASHRKDLS
jgi:FkbM family methyltransferase